MYTDVTVNKLANSEAKLRDLGNALDRIGQKDQILVSYFEIYSIVTSFVRAVETFASATASVGIEADCNLLNISSIRKKKEIELFDAKKLIDGRQRIEVLGKERHIEDIITGISRYSKTAEKYSVKFDLLGGSASQFLRQPSRQTSDPGVSFSTALFQCSQLNDGGSKKMWEGFGSFWWLWGMLGASFFWMVGASFLNGFVGAGLAIAGVAGSVSLRIENAKKLLRGLAEAGRYEAEELRCERNIIIEKFNGELRKKKDAIHLSYTPRTTEEGDRYATVSKQIQLDLNDLDKRYTKVAERLSYLIAKWEIANPEIAAKVGDDRLEGSSTRNRALRIGSLSVGFPNDHKRSKNATSGKELSQNIVSSAVRVARPVGGAKEEKTKFDVVLLATGSSKINVIKVVRAITGLSLAAAKELVETGGKVIKVVCDKAEAEDFKAKLEATGAEVELK